MAAEGSIGTLRRHSASQRPAEPPRPPSEDPLVPPQRQQTPPLNPSQPVSSRDEDAPPPREEVVRDGPAVPEFLEDRDFPVATEAGPYFTDAGRLGAVLVRGGIPEDLRLQASRVLRPAATHRNGRARINGGKPPLCGIVGYYDYKNKPTRRKYRRTAYAKENWEDIAHRVAPFLQRLAEVYKENAPEHYGRQLGAARQCRHYQLFGTPFSTLTVNDTFRTAAHSDSGDYEGGLGLLTVLEGTYIGCHLAIPDLGVAFDLRPGDVLAFDTRLRHGNTEFLSGTRFRVGVVAYLRTAFLARNCPVRPEPPLDVMSYFPESPTQNVVRTATATKTKRILRLSRADYSDEELSSHDERVPQRRLHARSSTEEPQQQPRRRNQKEQEAGAQRQPPQRFSERSQPCARAQPTVHGRSLPDQPTSQSNVATARRPPSECHTFDSLRTVRAASASTERLSSPPRPSVAQHGGTARARSRSRSECHLTPRVHSLADQRSPKRPRDDVSSNSNVASVPQSSLAPLVSEYARPPSAAVETLANELLRRCAGLPPTKRMKPDRVKGQSFALHESQQLLVVFNDPTASDVSMRLMRAWFGTKNTMFDVNFTHEIHDGHFVPLPPRTLVSLPCSGIQYWSMVTLTH